ncbi:glycoside hydrolase family 35 protein [Aureibacillus halotolerans]|uniref:Beta-galactosidase n=1 Tax=Aureibacillus halotolerans TaxID=1508390 RepID=A0A4R6U380_9BACI|nr:beta-galactosidase family protein [Aureibacillus halotolerans]TDQ40840.1 beta-galactosidase [Aureibacillus halotolerans]
MLTTENNQFLLNGQPFRILSGSIHYFRVVPEYWADRLQKLKECGFNTVETYIPWNVHEPKKGQFNFEGLADLEAFIQEADKLGLHVLLRPAPYICAEWEFGGLPAWLLKDRTLDLRCADPRFLEHLESYYNVLLPKIVPYLSTNGGPVLALQIENEYGAYGNDREYLQVTKEMFEEKGIDVLLFTSDGPDMIREGSLPDVLTTLNFGSRAEEAFQALDELKPGSPRMCAEYWIGWFDSWGKEHHTRPPEEAVDVLRTMLEAGASVNFYMFHGGTNFNFHNGANHYEFYDPTITSYDYDALLTESGEITEKYRHVQKVLQEYTTVPESTPTAVKRLPVTAVDLTASVSLFDTLSSIGKKTLHKTPLAMEDLDQAYGYVLYRVQVPGKGTYTIDADPIRDRASLYVNGEFKKLVYRNDEEKMITLDFPEEQNVLEIFVENMGRVNYGKHLKDRKGIIQNLWIDNKYLFDWEMYSIELEDVDVSISGVDTRYPRFFEGTLTVEEPADTFVQLEGWTKGNVFVNGFNLGRYWSIGPQKTLYVPGPLLKKGANRIQVLELEGTNSERIVFQNEADLG